MRITFLFSVLAVLFAACGGEKSLDPEPGPVPEPQPPVETKIPVNLSLGITKVTENSFDGGDKIGLYVVNYNGSIAGTLHTSGNHASNTLFTYNNVWQADSPLYWKDETTHADFYVYHPYSASVSNVNAHAITLVADQSSEANYKSCDFLWGKTVDIAPTSNAVNIQTRHIMSTAVITLVAGTGFTHAWNASTISVKMNHIKTGASINLATGAVSVSGTEQSIIPLYKDGRYHALVVPQTVSAKNFITVTVDGTDYNLNKEFTFKSGTRHSFTVTLEKFNSGINVGITGWEEDSVDNGGTAE